ncbi:MAG: sortase [Clostridia bacterium]|nr:sortase [Clostridia bacterium]
MNQILVTEKLYVTPELKRKKKIYKGSFVISIFLIFMLFSVYVYAQYDRNKSEGLSQEILTGMVIEEEPDTTTISKDDEVWVIDLQASKLDDYEEKRSVTMSASPSAKTTTTANDKKDTKTGKYTAPNGVTYNTVGTVSIPSIDVNYPILSETSEKLLKVSVCKFWGSNPNEVGNLCIAGHNYRNKKFFSKVPKLVVGDIIEITDLSKNTVRYKVYDKYTVTPDDVRCTSQLTNGKTIVTLITCTNDSKQRVVVKAEAIQ